MNKTTLLIGAFSMYVMGFLGLAIAPESQFPLHAGAIVLLWMGLACK